MNKSWRAVSGCSRASRHAGGHWHPHLMFFTPRMPGVAWGANLPGVPVMGGVDPATIFYVVVSAWSDGTMDEPMKMAH